VTTLKLFVDSSTKGDKGTRWGESIAAWMAVWGSSTVPVRAGVQYVRKYGPNVTFYEGVIRALESALTLVDGGDDVVVYGDCLLVLNHIKCSKPSNGTMLKYHHEVRSLVKKFGGTVRFEYLNEKDPTYKKADQLSKRARGFFRQVI
jgi:ribonuclease HI